ncbi:MAG TPA: ATP-binding protein [Polyangiaceae bacterium]
MIGTELANEEVSGDEDLLGTTRVSRKAEWLERLYGYGAGVAVVVICVALSLVGARVLQIADLVMIFPLGVLAVSVRFGIGPAIFTAVMAVLAFDFLFVPPTLTLAIPDVRSGVTLGTMLVVAVVSCVLAEQLRRQAEKARRQTEVERLRNALLSALSHDLRTPLTALVGASTALYEDKLDGPERREFARMVVEEATRLNRLVGNLLELTRLESGKVTAKRNIQAIDEVIGSALCRLERQLVGRHVRTFVPEEVPLIAFDPVLVEQVLINLVENAVKYTPPGSPIEVSVRVGQGHVSVDVADRGPGVPPGDEEKVFEKLYRGRNDTRGDGGVGLGLTICRAVVAAHEGRIVFQNRAGGGAVVRFTLPVRGNNEGPREPLPSLSGTETA